MPSQSLADLLKDAPTLHEALIILKDKKRTMIVFDDKTCTSLAVKDDYEIVEEAGSSGAGLSMSMEKRQGLIPIGKNVYYSFEL